MADNLTHSYTASKKSSKSTADGVYLSHSFTDINASASSKIPPYSQINSATASATATKDPTGTLSIGILDIVLGDSDGKPDTDSIKIANSNSLSYKNTESASGSILSYVKSKTSNAGHIECSGKSYVTVEPYFVYVFNQSFDTTLTITWNYNEPRAKVSVSKTGEGTVTGAGTYHYGTTYTIKATPATGWKFVKWSDGNTSASRTFTVNNSLITAYETSKSYQAVFEKQSYTISTSVSPSGSGSVSGGGSYQYGSTATLTATPASGYKFVKWSDGVTTASRTITVSGNVTHTAYFELNKINKIYIGTSQPKEIYIGTQQVKAVYIGTTKIYG